MFRPQLVPLARALLHGGARRFAALPALQPCRHASLLSRSPALAGQQRAGAAVAARPGAPHVRFLSDETKAEIDGIVNSDNVVVFMKGVPDAPQCGFSRAVVLLMEMHGIDLETLKTINVLENDAIREGIKEYSDWPTIPQVYLGGEFAGGCDIMISMHQNGELVDELAKVGHVSTYEGSEE